MPRFVGTRILVETFEAESLDDAKEEFALYESDLMPVQMNKVELLGD